MFHTRQVVVIDVNNLKNGRKPVKLQKERVKEIRRRGMDSLKINRQQHFVRKKVPRVDSVRWRGGCVRYIRDREEGVVMERVGGEWEALYVWYCMSWRIELAHIIQAWNVWPMSHTFFKLDAKLFIYVLNKADTCLSKYQKLYRIALHWSAMFACYAKTAVSNCTDLSSMFVCYAETAVLIWPDLLKMVAEHTCISAW